MRATFAVVILGLIGAIGWACGPFFRVAVFTYERHPDLPRTGFADGKLGVLMPSYARSYLVVAYRHLTGVGLDPREREQVLGYWTDRATAHWDKIDIDWEKRWEAARARVPGLPKSEANKLTGGTLALNADTNSFELNCAQDAFRNAVHTLDARSAQFGLDSRAVREWALAQTEVFENCDSEEAVIPDPAAADLPEIIRQDRAYQIAAAHLYAGDYDEARAAFEAIAADATSPWRTIAPYLVARTIARADEVPAAEAQARKILADPQLESTHGMTFALLRRLMVQQKDDEYFHRLSTLLASRGQGNGLREEIWEFTRLYDDFAGYDPFDFPDNSTHRKIVLEPLERDELPDWIATYQGIRPDAARHAYDRWKSTQRPHWLLAALSRAQAKTSTAPELINAATAITQDSPAYLTACFHRMRLMIDSGQGAAVKPALDVLLARGELPKSSVNLFRGLRMRVAPDLGDFLRFAQRMPVLMTSTADVAETPSYWVDVYQEKPAPARPLLDVDSAMVFNQYVPVAIWKQAAETTSLTAALKKSATLAAFTRAVVVGAHDIAQPLAARLPQSDAVKGYVQETTVEGRNFAGAFVLLHMPESTPYMRSGASRESDPGTIDNFRDNWWCAVNPDVDTGLIHTYYAPGKDHVNRAPGITFLHPAEIATAEKERQALTQAGGGSRFLARTVLAYAKAHPDDPRVPEALHLAVRANRYACDASSDWHTTRDCFRLLHLRYPKSEWTRKTPIWNQ